MDVDEEKLAATGEAEDSDTNLEVSFMESTGSDASESDGEWDNLPPYPTTTR